MRMLWYFLVFIWHFYFFCLESTVRKGVQMETTSFTVINIFWKYYAESYLITGKFKVHSQQSLATLTIPFWNTPDSWRFCKHGSTCVHISWAITVKRMKLGLHFKEHFTNMEDDISLIFIRFFFCPRNIIFQFSLVLI